MDEQQPEQQVPIDEGPIDEAMTVLAIPANTETYFTTMAEPETAVQSIERPADPIGNADEVLKGVDIGELFVRMLNQGNMLDIGINAETEGPEWQRLAQSILSIETNPEFHLARCQILSPLLGTQDDAQREAVMAHGKQVIMAAAPPGVNPDDISWDAVSFKIAPTAMEYFCQKNPVALKQFDQAHIVLIDQIEKVCGEAIAQKCSEFRARTGQAEDEFISDSAIFLEMQLAGREDNDRATRIARVGRGTLISYVDKMQAVFLTGNLPSAIQPSKIYACHDLVSAIELRGSIQKLAEKQVSQSSRILGNPKVMGRAYTIAGSADTQWTQTQAASILLKRNVDTFQRRLYNTLGDNYEQPMARLENQLVGSSNTLAVELEARTSDAVVTQNEEQKETSRQQLSVLLACLRMRANAVQQSDWELVSDDDLDHMEIVKYLSHMDESIDQGNDDLYKTAALLQQSYSTGHNVVKFNDRMLPNELVEVVNYTMEGRAKIIAKQIPTLEQDLKSGSNLFKILLQCVLTALTQKQRIQAEFNDRLARKRAITQAVFN